MKENSLTGKFYDIQGFSVHDGPGIRLTMFMKGCPLRCPWCHSPESQAFQTELNWMEIKCIGIEACGNCLSVCPQGAITPGRKAIRGADQKEITLVHVDRNKCDNCGKCESVCTPKALYLCGKDYTVDEIMDRVRRDIPFFKTSGGGVTVSGGECLSQPDFLLEVLKRCKEEGVHTAVDTTGYASWGWYEKILPYTDLFLYDLKNMDSEKHRKVVGVPNERILENAQKIASAGGKFQIRIPVIPMFNDSQNDFQSYGEFISGLGDAVEVVQLLPYHNMGTVKWERLHREAPVMEVLPPSEKKMEKLKKLLEDVGIPAMIH